MNEMKRFEKRKIVLLILSISIILSAVNGQTNNTSISDNANYGETDNITYEDNDTTNITSNNSNAITSNSPNASNSSNVTTNVTYKVLVDGYYGFFRVYNLNLGEELRSEEYEDKTFYIHEGDTVIWSNEDLSESFTVASEPKLWSDRKGYLSSGKKFSYTFNESGMYNIFIRQTQTLPNQTIIVQSLNPLNSSQNRTAKVDNVNKTIILKKKNNPEPEIKIKIYRKPKEPKETSGFEILISIPIIIIIYILRQYKIDR